MEILGWLPFGLGTAVIALGGLYAFLEYRYAGAILYWASMWGLMLAGFGLALMGTQRRWVAVTGMMVCVISAVLTAYWHHLATLDQSWLWLIGAGCSAGILYGAVAVVWQTLGLRRARRVRDSIS
jgi:hypothetical protein